MTVAFTAQAHSDSDLSTTQRDAYREFRAYLAELIRDDEPSSTDHSALLEAERLIALVDGVALQALFDPDSWPPERQLQALDIGLGVLV